MLLSIPLVLIGLELLVRLLVGVSGKTDELAVFQGEPLKVSAYRLKYLDRSGKLYDGLSNQGQLTVKQSPVMGYRLMGNQQQQDWAINEQGFRSDQAIAPDKPKDEVRIFVLGGSTAFGQLSSTNQTTFTKQLEDRLNQQVVAQKENPGKFRPAILPYFADELDKALALPAQIRDSRYRVINAAVPGYISGNELSKLAFDVLSYKPDFIVVLNGYADLLVPSTQEGSDIPGTETLLESAPRHLLMGITEQVKTLISQLFLVKAFQYWVLQPQDALKQVVPPVEGDAPLAQRLPTEADELSRRVDRYRQNMQQFARLTSASKIPLIVAMQPEITGRDPSQHTPREKEILNQLGANYPQQVKAGYSGLQRSLDQVKKEVPQVTTFNFYNAYADFKGEAFQDAIHLTDAANASLSNRLFDAISKQLQLQPKPYGGTEPPAS
ncbi:SGNH/GDSL hydrolase family protein [Myxacorys almedinensis A]|uniref:SGNH/GDSL hydrolase family protein n=1 Tax=Myxacorys almedinensis A TaxID=2690445 RepID=A0A8J8CJ14_9CYAN|nr:SGNH/GDSL hydrolase family protein [Myxacorys almedinensis A]